MSLFRLFVIASFALSCKEFKETGEPTDADGDGYSAQEDCDDGNNTIHPGAQEYCDGIDNNCDDIIDPEDSVNASLWYADADDDGYGDESSTVAACEAPEGFSADSSDCDDSNGDIHPGASEVCDELDTDEDCDGLADDEDTDGADGKTLAYPDSDGDGFGDKDDAGSEYCDLPASTVLNNSDCDDDDDAIHPGATEDICSTSDNNCDGVVGTEAGGWIDFKSMELGTFPEGWAMRWDDAGQTVTGQIGENSSGRFFEIRSSESPYYRVAAQKEGVEAEDIEVLFLTPSFGGSYFNFALRAQGDSHTGHNAYIFSSNNTNNKIVRELDSSDSYGGWSYLATMEASYSSATWVRFRVEGNTIKARRWNEEDSEPAEWDLEVTDDEISGAGWFGPVTFTNYYSRLRRLSWATGGATATNCSVE